MSQIRPQVSDHFDGKHFFNPDADVDRGLGDLLRWRLSRQRAPWPRRRPPPAPPPAPAVDDGRILATLIGHATLLVQCGGFNILTDPVFSSHAGPFGRLGPQRVQPPALSLDALPPIHVVLLSHNHFDHMDVPSLRRLQARWNPPVVTGLGNGAYLAGKGIGPGVELDWWQSAEPFPGLRVTYVPARHWSMRGLFDRRRMLWGGHVVETAAGRLYFAGDTGYSSHFAEIRRRLGSPHVALLPIGAYLPRWFMAPQHMDPDEAVRAHLDLEAHLSVAMHFATFRLSDEAVDAPVRRLEEACAHRGVPPGRFRVPEFGRPLAWGDFSPGARGPDPGR